MRRVMDTHDGLDKKERIARSILNKVHRNRAGPEFFVGRAGIYRQQRNVVLASAGLGNLWVAGRQQTGRGANLVMVRR